MRVTRTFTNALPPNPPGSQALIYHRHDHLFVENKAAEHDIPSGWKILLQEATSRLKSICANVHDVYLICAIGLRYMIFYWDPTSTGLAAQPALWGQLDNGTQYGLPTELRPMTDFKPHVLSDYRVDHTLALKLNPSNPSTGNSTLECYLNNVRSEALRNAHRSTS
jgi:hypothetical protein